MSSLATRLSDLAVRIATECKSIRTLLNGNVGTNGALKTTAKTNLVAAINEVYDRVTGAGTGDMQKATYDTNGDGVVDRASVADAAPWVGITNKPASYPPSAHDASLVTSGVFDPARIPVLPSQVQVISDGGLADLTAAKQASIGQGTVVTTTDGFRYVYSGSGSKTDPTSYVALADITPEFAAIANKPSTLSGYGITDAVLAAAIGNPDTNFVTVFENGLQ